MTAYIDTALFVKSFVLEADSPETVTILESVGEPFSRFPRARSRHDICLASIFFACV
jgi:hypothetical protein